MIDGTALRPSITVGISGGSGSIYALRMLQILSKYYRRVDVVMSNASRQVLAQETEVEAPVAGVWTLPGAGSGEEERVTVWNNQNYSAPFASGSNCAEQMLIVPCSMSTVASIAHGIDQNLMHHAAGVTIKEKKELIIVPRETPLSASARSMSSVSRLSNSRLASCIEKAPSMAVNGFKANPSLSKGIDCVVIPSPVELPRDWSGPPRSCGARRGEASPCLRRSRLS